MCDHGHGHSHGHSHGSDSSSGEDIGVGNFNLFLKIDFNRLTCLNEAVDESAKQIFRPWDDRKDFSKFVESDADEELLINVPFTGNVKLKSVVIIGGQESSAPNQLRLFKNRPHMTFDDAGMEPDQELALTRDSEGSVEYPTKIVKFSNVNSVTLHFPSNFGEETTKIYYIGLKGDFTEAAREGILIANYESAPNPADHKLDQFSKVHSQIH